MYFGTLRGKQKCGNDGSVACMRTLRTYMRQLSHFKSQFYENKFGMWVAATQRTAICSMMCGRAFSHMYARKPFVSGVRARSQKKTPPYNVHIPCILRIWWEWLHLRIFYSSHVVKSSNTESWDVCYLYACLIAMRSSRFANNVNNENDKFVLNVFASVDWSQNNAAIASAAATNTPPKKRRNESMLARRYFDKTLKVQTWSKNKTFFFFQN